MPHPARTYGLTGRFFFSYSGRALVALYCVVAICGGIPGLNAQALPLVTREYIYANGNIVALENVGGSEDCSRTITPGGAPEPVSLPPMGSLCLAINAPRGRRISLWARDVTAIGSLVTLRSPERTPIVSVAPSATSGGFLRASTLDLEGVYTLSITSVAATAISMTLTLYNVVDLTGTITPGGAPVTVTTDTPGQSARLTFSGTMNQRIRTQITGAQILGCMVGIYRSTGSPVPSSTATITTLTRTISAVTLPVNDTYTFLIDNSATGSTGAITVELLEVSDLVIPVTPNGQPVVVTISLPEQDARMTFNGTTGQKIFADFSSVTFPSGAVFISLRRPDGTPMVGPFSLPSSGTFIDTRTLPTDGVYTILADHPGTSSGQFTLRLYDAADLVLPIAPGGGTVRVQTAVPGQDVRLPFNAAQGQNVSMMINNVVLGWAGGRRAWILRPDGTELFRFNNISATVPNFMDTRTLTAGVHTVYISHNGGPGTYSMDVTLYNVLDFEGTISIGGPEVTVPIDTPGRRGRLTFPGTAGQRLRLRYFQESMGQLRDGFVRISNPDGTTLISLLHVSPCGALCTHNFTLPEQTGTYTILVYASPAYATGNVRLGLVTQ